MRLVNVLLLLILFIGYWYVVRPLPKTSGEIAAPIGAAATIKRDARGVPHIEAASWQDAIFLQGFVTAQDRLWQMDLLRRFAAGDLAEVFGPVAVPADQRARSIRMRAMAEANVQRLRNEDRAVLVEYARGVNHFIDTHRGDYSLEFSLPGRSYDPRPWSLTDSMLIGLLMFRDLADSTLDDLAKGSLIGLGADPARFHLLFPTAAGANVSPGSNAWAVSGARTADGKPMAANDPHLQYGIPGTWHLVHLKAPGLNVSGAALPGVPCVITGHNEQIAWGVTNLQTDVLDVYREQLDQQTGRYLFQGRVEQAKLDRQSIAVKGAKPVAMDVWVTRHGPVFSDKGKSYSVRWSAADGFGFPFFQINRAKDWNEFREALRVFWGPGQNFIYADRAGNIGYQATGAIPIRRTFDGDIPLDGTSGHYEWDSYIPFDQLPSVYNPPSGIVATANQNPFPKDYPYRIAGSFADRYRVTQIKSLLNAKPKLATDDMLAVQKDVYSAYDRFLAQQVVAAYSKASSPGKSELADAAVSILRPWNGQMDKDQSAPVIAELLSNELRGSLVRLLVPKAKDVPDLLPRPQIVETLLRERPPGWAPNDDWDVWLLAGLTKALETGRKQQGSVVTEWRWGRVMHWKFEHPVMKELPPIDWFFNLIYQRSGGPFEMSGAGTTVKQTTLKLGPSERMVVDLGDLDKSVQNLPLGESGFVASTHYEDQWPAYYVGKSFPMQFDKVDAHDVLTVTPAR